MVYGLLQGRDLKLDVKSFGKQSFHSDLPVKGRKFLYQFTKEGGAICVKRTSKPQTKRSILSRKGCLPERIYLYATALT